MKTKYVISFDRHSLVVLIACTILASFFPVSEFGLLNRSESEIFNSFISGNFHENFIIL